MTRTSLAFFVLAIFTVLAGSYGITGLSIEVIQILSIILLMLGLLSYIGSIVTNHKSNLHHQ